MALIIKSNLLIIPLYTDINREIESASKGIAMISKNHNLHARNTPVTILINIKKITDDVILRYGILLFFINCDVLSYCKVSDVLLQVSVQQ